VTTCGTDAGQTHFLSMQRVNIDADGRIEQHGPATLEQAGAHLHRLLGETDADAVEVVTLPQSEAVVLAELLAELDARLPATLYSRREHDLNVLCQWLAGRLWRRLGI
jgi:hypothetical protein